uniref:Uncharacterized protein n=1 Tax=Phytophthora fragariae TaxID=53985 RepID=A0A6A3D5W3_9STRA|nr:hypothetical protein PF009_g32948 [Phytophthora fragariae]
MRAAQERKIAIMQHGRVDSQTGIVHGDELILGTQSLVLALEHACVSGELGHRGDGSCMGRNGDLGRVRKARPVRSARADNARVGLEVACVELVLLVEKIRATCHGALKTPTAAEKCGTVGNAASETIANTQGTV